MEIGDVEYLLFAFASSRQDEACRAFDRKASSQWWLHTLNASLLATPAMYFWSIKSFGARHAGS
jgi:hypothetical protein